MCRDRWPQLRDRLVFSLRAGIMLIHIQGQILGSGGLLRLLPVLEANMNLIGFL